MSDVQSVATAFSLCYAMQNPSLKIKVNNKANFWYENDTSLNLNGDILQHKV